MLKLNSNISEYSFFYVFHLTSFQTLSSACKSSARGFFHVEMQEEISQGPDNLMRKQFLSAQDGSRSLVLGISWDPKRFCLCCQRQLPGSSRSWFLWRGGRAVTSRCFPCAVVTGLLSLSHFSFSSLAFTLFLLLYFER